MGYTFAKVRLCNPVEQSKTLDLDLIVDTGSTYTWFKRSRLKSLELKPTGRRLFKTIEGRLVEREIGEAIIEYEEERATTIIVFSEEGDAEVLGVYALEGLGLEVDPTTRGLKKSEAIPALVLYTQNDHKHDC
jgi:predicted aspartyl protease